MGAGRSLNMFEGAGIVVILVLIKILAPPVHATLAQAAFLVIASLYSAWITRGRWSYVFVAVALLLLLLAIMLPPVVPSGPVPTE